MYICIHMNGYIYSVAILAQAGSKSFEVCTPSVLATLPTDGACRRLGTMQGDLECTWVQQHPEKIDDQYDHGTGTPRTHWSSLGSV